MRRAILILSTLILAADAALAQKEPIVPMAAVSQARKLGGEKKIRYILRQLDLKLEQRQHAHGLIATILDDSVNPPLSLAQVHTIVAEIEEAKKQGDAEREKQLGQQLRDLASSANRDGEFFENMATVLTEEQKTKMAAVQARLKRNPSGALRPIDLYRVLKELKLDSGQQKKLDELHQKIRDDLRKMKSMTDEARFQLVNGFIDAANGILSQEQRALFDRRIRQMRPDIANELHVPWPKQATEADKKEPAAKKPAGE